MRCLHENSARMKRGRRCERGAVAVVIALSLPVLIGLLAWVVDMGRVLVVRSELQTMADACALAAAAALPSSKPDAATLRRAEAHGLVPGDPLATNVSGITRPALSVNRFDFQSRAAAAGELSVQFSDSATGPWTAAADTGTGKVIPYARCTAQPQALPLLLAGAIGAWSRMPVTATAVATTVPGQIACGFPVALCRAAGSGSGSSPPYGLNVGQWFQETLSSGSNRYGSGNFGWIDFSPPRGGADELAKSIEGRGACALSSGQVVGESGMKSGVYDSWNSRFGLYSPGGPNAVDSPGDFSGFAYTPSSWPAQANAYSGNSSGGSANFLANRAAFAPYQGNQLAGVNAKFTINWSASQRKTIGRDRRLVVVPVVNCSLWNSNGSAQPAIEAWACALLLSPVGTGSGKNGPGRVEYLGLAGSPDSPCASGGLPGGSASGGPRVPALVQ